MSKLYKSFRESSFAIVLALDILAALVMGAMWLRILHWSAQENHFDEVSRWILGGALISLTALLVSLFSTAGRRVGGFIISILLLLVGGCHGMGA